MRKLIIEAGTNISISSRGIYFLTDGAAVMARRVDRVPQHNGQLLYRIIADNERVATREINASQVRLLGRLIGKVSMFF